MNLRRSSSLALAAALFAGCTGCLKDGSSAIGSVGATVGHSEASGTWTVGITISFKQQPPTPATEAKLREAGAVKLSETVFALPKYDRSQRKQGDAIEASLREGAVLTGR